MPYESGVYKSLMPLPTDAPTPIVLTRACKGHTYVAQLCDNRYVHDGYRLPVTVTVLKVGPKWSELKDESFAGDRCIRVTTQKGQTECGLHRYTLFATMGDYHTYCHHSAARARVQCWAREAARHITAMSPHEVQRIDTVISRDRRAVRAYGGVRNHVYAYGHIYDRYSCAWEDAHTDAEKRWNPWVWCFKTQAFLGTPPATAPAMAAVRLWVQFNRGATPLEQEAT